MKSRAPTMDHGAFELARWVAIVTMTIDHYGKIVDPSVLDETHLIGRLSYPLFAGVIGVRLAMSPELATRYVRRLLVWAFISQPVFVEVGRQWFEGNIFFTLASGVILAVSLERSREAPIGAILTGITALGLALFVEYGIPGALMVVIIHQIARRDLSRALTAFGPIGVLANFVPAPPWIADLDWGALGTTLVAWGSVRSHLRLPRLPGIVFYAYYPAHLMALHYLDLYLLYPR